MKKSITEVQTNLGDELFKKCKKIITDNCKKLCNNILNNGVEFSKNVKDVTPAGIVIGAGAGALSILAMATNEMKKSLDIDLDN